MYSHVGFKDSVRGFEEIIIVIVGRIILEGSVRIREEALRYGVVFFGGAIAFGFSMSWSESG